MRSPLLTPEQSLTLLASAAERFTQVLADGDLTAAVPFCPGWTLADLGGHLAEIHLWAAHAIVAGNPDADPPETPKDPTRLAGWYRDAADRLLDILGTTAPDARTWTFGPHPRTASFWSRRQGQEARLHVWDALRSQGVTEPIAEDVALDGIDEVVAMFFPRQVRLGRISALAHSLALEAGGGYRWVLAGDGTGAASEPQAPAEVTVSGSGQALHLLLWGRIGVGDPGLLVHGDEEVARAVVGAGLTP